MSEPLIKVPDVQFERAKLMLDRARWAAARMQKLDRATTRHIIDAVAAAGHAKAQHYAEWAVRETGMGVVEHKRIKNEACSKGLVELYGNEDFISPRIDQQKKIVELPRPAGVIFALIPVTNPVATVFFKTLLALMTRNAIILSPHPQAKACCSDAARVLAEAAKAATYTATFRKDLPGSDAFHWGEGTVSVTPQKIVHQGTLAPGPDYKIYLAPSYVDTDAGFRAIKEQSVQLGSIKSYNGFITEVPAGVNIEDYDTIVIWCEAFGKFITAGKYR